MTYTGRKSEMRLAILALPYADKPDIQAPLRVRGIGLEHAGHDGLPHSRRIRRKTSQKRSHRGPFDKPDLSDCKRRWALWIRVDIHNRLGHEFSASGQFEWLQ